jgi:hypothetical protein
MRKKIENLSHYRKHQLILMLKENIPNLSKSGLDRLNSLKKEDLIEIIKKTRVK